MAKKQQSEVVRRVSEFRRSKKGAQVTITPDAKVSPAKKKIAKTAMMVKTGSTPFGGGHIMGTATNIYSPHLSPDFLELPQNLTEQRSYYRHFYNNDPYVGQAIDLHTELPLSKIRLAMPKGKDPKRNREILNFFQEMIDRMQLLQRLIDGTREYYVIGEAFLFAEDTPVEVPPELYVQTVHEIDESGNAITREVERENWRELEEEYVRLHYQGWKTLMILPPEQVHLESHQFSTQNIIELIPDARTASLVARARQGDQEAAKQYLSIPVEIREYLEQGRNIPLGTDPDNGSFVYQLARHKSGYQLHGVSILQRCMRTLVYRDKIRQAQTSIASRAMTPKRLIYAEDLSEHDVEELRDQVDAALLDPDYSIITNYQVSWEEISADSRLLNASGEFDQSNSELFAGLGVTESMLTGDGQFGAEKINLEILNNRYLLYRDQIQSYVEEYLFKPVARKKGFVEMDEYGNEVLLYPRLSFTRLAVRDNRDTFDALFNLYQKGSLSVNYILELFNLDPDTVREQNEKDLFTVNDPTFNEVIRGIYSEVGRMATTHTDFTESFFNYLGKISQIPFKYVEPSDGDGSRY